MPNRGRYWRCNYRFDGKPKTLALGVHGFDRMLEDLRQIVLHARSRSTQCNCMPYTPTGMKFGIALLILVVLLFSCHGSPPKPMPWQSSDTHAVKTLSSDYDVSRFWACGWAGGCPLKEWKYCLRITPKEPLAALLWYSRTSKEYREIAQEIMDGSEPANWSVNAPIALGARITYRRQYGQLHDREVKLMQEIRRIQENDRAAIDAIMEKTHDGLLYTALYQLIGDKRPTGWSIYPGCPPR
jgi:hypothetical protein